MNLTEAELTKIETLLIDNISKAQKVYQEFRDRIAESKNKSTQPSPQPSTVPQIPDIYKLVIQDLETRAVHGKKKYSVALQAFNGRNGLQDLYEELLDGVNYCKQKLVEENIDNKSYLDFQGIHSWEVEELKKAIESSGYNLRNFTQVHVSDAGWYTILSTYLTLRKNRVVKEIADGQR